MPAPRRMPIMALLVAAMAAAPAPARAFGPPGDALPPALLKQARNDLNQAAREARSTLKSGLAGVEADFVQHLKVQGDALVALLEEGKSAAVRAAFVEDFAPGVNAAQAGLREELLAASTAFAVEAGDLLVGLAAQVADPGLPKSFAVGSRSPVDVFRLAADRAAALTLARMDRRLERLAQRLAKHGGEMAWRLLPAGRAQEFALDTSGIFVQEYLRTRIDVLLTLSVGGPGGVLYAGGTAPDDAQVSFVGFSGAGAQFVFAFPADPVGNRWGTPILDVGNPYILFPANWGCLVDSNVDNFDPMFSIGLR